MLRVCKQGLCGDRRAALCGDGHGVHNPGLCRELLRVETRTDPQGGSRWASGVGQGHLLLLRASSVSLGPEGPRIK